MIFVKALTRGKTEFETNLILSRAEVAPDLRPTDRFDRLVIWEAKWMKTYAHKRKTIGMKFFCSSNNEGKFYSIPSCELFVPSSEEVGAILKFVENGAK